MVSGGGGGGGATMGREKSLVVARRCGTMGQLQNGPKEFRVRSHGGDGGDGGGLDVK